MKIYSNGQLLFPLVCSMLLSSVESFNWTVQPTNPTQVIKGEDVSLTWQYTLTADEQLKSQTFYGITWKKLNQSSLNYEKIGSIVFAQLAGVPAYSEPKAPHIQIDRNDAATLLINNVRREDEGTYRIEYSLEFDGTVLADHEVNVTVLERSEIVYISNDQDVCEGSTVTLDCNATGIPVPNITWTRVWENGTDSEKLPAVHGYYVIRNISRSSNGTYRCTAYNGVGDPVNRTVEVIVRYSASVAEVIRSSNTVTEGDAYNLNCEVSGNPMPQVTWIKVSNDQRSDGNILNFTNIKRNDTGDYRCEASNRCGKKNRTERINVFYKPDTVTLKSNATKNKNCSDLWVNFTCISSEANPPVYNYLLFGDNKTFSVNKNGTWILDISKGGKVTYNCLAYQLVDNVSSENITLTVNVPPHIEKPKDKVVIEGRDLEVYCVETGFPFPEATVKHGSDTFYGNLLNITKITRAQAGEYKCTANNTCGTKSEVANIYVHYPPENVTLIANTTGNKVCTGDVVNFICTAQANPPVHTYLLYQNDTVIKNMTSSGKLIETMKTPGQFEFRCEANNSVKDIVRSNNTIVLTVEVPASVKQAENKSLVEGNNVQVYCDATGIPNPTILWTNVKNNVVVSKESLLNITNINKTQAGEYRCTANNTCGNASTMVNIDVQYPPSITDISPNITANETGSVTLNCTADGNPQSYITWTNVSGDKVPSSFKISGKENEGYYTCTAQNGIGNPAAKEVFIFVEYHRPVKTMLTTTAINKSVNVGEAFSINCSAEANPPAEYRFHKEQDSINGNVPVITTSVNETVNQVTYSCTPSNVFGNGTTAKITVEVLFPPNVTSKDKVVVYEGCRATLTCPVRGNPSPTIVWYKENINIPSKDRNLTISSATLENSGFYICSANNRLGTVNASVYLNVTVGPKNIPLTCTIQKESNSSKMNETCKMFSTLACNLSAWCVCSEVTGCRPGSIVVDFLLKFSQKVSASDVVSNLNRAAKESKFGSLTVDPNCIKQISSSPSTTEPTSTERTFTKGPECVETFFIKSNCEIKWVIVGIIIGVIVALVVVVIVIVWWVHKKRKCRKDTRVCDSSPDVQPLASNHSTLSEDNNYAKVNNGYAKSGPLPTGDNIDVEQPPGAAATAAIPTYAVVDKSKKKDKKKDKKASEQKPPDDQYAAVDKSKKKKKNEPDATYAEVDMSKKSKKPPKHKPDEVLYADLGNFHQMKEMPQVSTSPKALPPIKRPEPYAETQYADITQFLKGNPENTGTDSPKEGATLPDSNSSQAPAAGSKEESSAGNTGEGAKANEETLL